MIFLATTMRVRKKILKKLIKNEGACSQRGGRPCLGAINFCDSSPSVSPPMSATPNSIGVSADTGPMTPTELSDDELPVRISIDLVAAARRHIAFLRAVAESEWLHQESTMLESIRRSPTSPLLLI